jgi:acylphosphatase
MNDGRGTRDGAEPGGPATTGEGTTGPAMHGAAGVDDGDRARIEATVRGRVQGVGFRYFVRSVADELALTGWVANAPDGTVVCAAEGPRSALRRFARALEEGPAGSRVDRVDTRWMVPIGTDGRFIIRSLGHGGD